MKCHQDTVGSDLHVGLDIGIAGVDGVLERGHRVLRHVAGAATVSEWDRPIPFEIGVKARSHPAQYRRWT